MPFIFSNKRKISRCKKEAEPFTIEKKYEVKLEGDVFKPVVVTMRERKPKMMDQVK